MSSEAIEASFPSLNQGNYKVTSPEDFKLLLRVFLDAESSAGASRPLIGWIEVAKSRQCKHHSWVTQYLTARERLGMVVVGLDGGALPAAPATGKAPGNFGWTVNKPTRFHGYTWPLYIVVQRWHEAGQQAPPSAFDVLQAWRGELPAEIERVLLDGFDCDGKNVATSALKQAIRRMTSTPTQR